MKKSIMIQGTTSSAGKSLLVTALCRIFLQDGCNVAPFKSQNMSLNSFITDEGLEMGRAQAVQAEAAGIKPEACMNPILLKPSSDRKSQVIVEGKAVGSMDAREYYGFKSRLKDTVVRNFNDLRNRHEVIVIEGAGSPAEINLKENDFVNMGMAEIADCPVIIIADIDRGGVFASIIGTYMLLDENEKSRVKGFVINKFRGDIDILKPGIVKIEQIVGIPILGVIPFLDINIEDEDSLSDKFNLPKKNAQIRICVIKLPHISNFTDMEAFKLFDAEIMYAASPDQLNDPDILIIPGTKNTIDDLYWLKENGFEEKIISIKKNGGVIAGICGGFQMMGLMIKDPHCIESDRGEIKGLGLIDMTTVMLKEKITKQTEFAVVKSDGMLSGTAGMKIAGYEIHMGETSYNADVTDFIDPANPDAGIVKDNILGTYIHGFFDNTAFTGRLLDAIMKTKGRQIAASAGDYGDYKQKEYDRLAEAVRTSINMDKVYSILNGGA